MDFCGPMRVASVNGNKYIFVIVDDYSRFTWVKCLRSKDEAPDFIIKFLKIIQVRLKVPVRQIRTDNGTEFVNQTLRKYYEKVGISHETSVARSPQQNGVVERRNRTLIEDACTMLIYAKASLFLWAEAVATVCYTQNCSNIRLRHSKTPYEILHDKLPDLSFFHIFGALCYPTNDSENLDKLQPKADIDFDKLTAMASEHSSSGPTLHEMIPDIFFQPLFDELLNPPSSVDRPAPEVIALIVEVVAPEPAASTSSPSSKTVDQDAPSPSNSQTTPETQSPVIPNDVEEDNHDLDVAHINNDSFFGIPIPENNSESSSSSDVIPTIVPISTRLQLYEQVLTSVEPKNYKDALNQACWIKAMQQELNEFEHLEVWKLVPRPDKVMVITLKWIYKVKLDELGGILKNKARLVARGYRQEEEIDFEKSFALMTRLNVIRIFLAYAAHMNMILYHTDVKAALLNAILCEKVYVTTAGEYGSRHPNHISQSPRGIFINQSKYALESLKKYGMESSDPVDTPMVEKSKLDEDTQGKAVDPTHYRGMVGTLMYLTATYADADHAGCQDTRRSTSGSMQVLGDRLVSWSSKRSQLTDYGLGFNKILMYCDNKSIIALCCNNVKHSRSKHIDIRFHFIKEQVENGVVELYFVNTEYQLADIFTKALGRERIEFLINNMGMRSFTPETLKQLADDVEE
ncbi:integrase, catalytic region, zinc finger, CCHC-type containing protein [Tanacetum coccineum]